MGVLVIYHSRGLLPGRQAAAIHLGVDLSSVPQGEGLIPLGPDPQADRVAALTGVASGGVAERAFESVAAASGLAPGGWLLQSVGPPTHWPERWAMWLGYIGLGALARRWVIAPAEAEAHRAVAEVRQRLAAARGGGAR